MEQENGSLLELRQRRLHGVEQFIGVVAEKVTLEAGINMALIGHQTRLIHRTTTEPLNNLFSPDGSFSVAGAARVAV